jgi:phage-related protein
MGKTVVFYRTADGHCPVEEFLDSLPAKAAQKATWTLSLLEDLEIVPSAYFKKLGGTDGIWECRFVFGSNAYRLLCFFPGRSAVVLTHGFVKKSQKTPGAEIERAEGYKKDFLNTRTRNE